jgi:hypothetical protein
MREDEIRARLAGLAVIAVDTNVVWREGLLDLIDLVNLVNQGRAGEQQLAVRIPALVHAERLFQERRRRGPDYDEAKPLNVLRNKGAEIVAFDKDDASRHAERLAQCFPTDADWHRAKKPGGTTVDWFIATQCAARGWVLVSDDLGGEFAWCDAIVGRKEILDALRALAGPPP